RARTPPLAGSITSTRRKTSTTRLRWDLLLHRPGGPHLQPGEDRRNNRWTFQHALLRRAEPFRPEPRQLRAAGLDLLLADHGDMGWWASSSGGYGLSDAAESMYAPINYVVPISYGNPNVTRSTFTTNYEYPRVNAFGSLHPGGASFAMVDG